MSNLLAGGLALLAFGGLWVPATSATLTDRSGRPLPARVSFQLSSAGIAGRTTLDARVQRFADTALDDGLTQARSEGLSPTGGAVVVLGLRERAVLALASAPEPNRLRAVEALPAGSVVKPFVALAALGEGLNGSERRPCPARFSADGATIRNWTGRDGPPMDISGAIAQSCNTVFASLAASLWDRGERSRLAIQRTFAGFGFGLPTGLVPGERPGRVPFHAASAGDLMVLAIGQGPLSVTPLQVAWGFARIAGDGGQGWTAVTGRRVSAGGRGLPAELAVPVRRGLEEAVRDGTARESFNGLDLNRMPVAGKTGSAEIGDVTPYGWFAAYAPADDPRYVIAVVIERGRAGAISAAPVARRVLDSLLHLPRERPPFPLPHPATALIALPLAAAFASPAAASLAGLAAGSAAGAIAGGSIAAGVVAFAAAGWIAAFGRRRRWWMFALGAGIATVALPAVERPLWWIAARALVSAGVTAAAFVAAARRRRET